MDKIKLMSHLVAGYPADEIAMTAATALVEGGTDMLEIQLPFSDPSADGHAIQSACTEVLKRKFRTSDGLNFIRKVHEKFPDIPVFVMSYGSLVYTPGVENFCRKAAEAGAKGMIIPDLPFDFDEGLSKACTENGMMNIPVAAPGMSEERLAKMATAGFPYVYAALRTGITGTETKIDGDTMSFLKKVGAGGSRILGGFGISTGSQSAMLASCVEAVVCGSVFVRLITEFKDDEKKLFDAVKSKAMEISHLK